MLTDDRERAAGDRRRARPRQPRAPRRPSARSLAAAERGAARAARRARATRRRSSLAGEGWHPGVIGIVASRLVERHHRPGVADRARRRRRRARARAAASPASTCSRRSTPAPSTSTRYGGHRAAAGLELRGRARRRLPRGVRRPRRARRSSPADLVPDRARRRGRRRRDASASTRRGARAPGPVRHGQPRRARCSSRRRGSRDVRPMGEGASTRASASRAAPARALGVAFGVNGELAGAPSDEPLDVAVRLEVNHWNGAVEPRVVLARRSTREPSPDAARADGAPRATRGAATSWWRRASTPSSSAELGPRPPRAAPATARGSAAWSMRRGGVGGGDARRADVERRAGARRLRRRVRRRELVERAAAPGAASAAASSALACGARCADGELARRGRARRPARPGAGRLGGARRATRARRRASSTSSCSTRRRSPHLERRCAAAPARRGFLHLGWGAAERRVRAARCCDDEWALRGPLAGALPRRCAEAGERRRRAARARRSRGDGAPPARRPRRRRAASRVLGELGLAGRLDRGASAAVRGRILGEDGAGALRAPSRLLGRPRGGPAIPAASTTERAALTGTAPTPTASQLRRRATRRGHIRVGASTRAGRAAPASTRSPAS